MLALAEQRISGIFNATGPDAPMTFGQMLDTMREQFAPQAALRWADEAWLLAQGIAPWSDLPLWLPQASHGMLQIDVSRARALGLVCRPLPQTLADTAAWAVQDNEPSESKGPPRPAVGLTPDRELQLLASRIAVHDDPI